jgi:hypothetical protein
VVVDGSTLFVKPKKIAGYFLFIFCLFLFHSRHTATPCDNGSAFFVWCFWSVQHYLSGDRMD